MFQMVKRFVISCVVAVILEFVLFHVYSYLYTISGNAPISFSISRVIAMLGIYWGTCGLIFLQKSPDYGIIEGDISKENET